MSKTLIFETTVVYNKHILPVLTVKKENSASQEQATAPIAPSAGAHAMVIDIQWRIMVIDFTTRTDRTVIYVLLEQF